MRNDALRWVICVMAITPLGCSMRPEWDEPHVRAGRAAGLGEAIEIRSEGGRLNAEGVIDEPITLSDAVGRAIRQSSHVQASLAAVRMAYAEAWGERLLPNPVLSVALRFPEGASGTIVEAGLAADLVSVLRMEGRVAAADARLRSASASVIKTVLGEAAEVERTFFEVIALEARADLTERRLGLTGRLLGLAESRFEAGEGGKLEVVALRGESAGAEADLHELLLELREQRLRLARLLGVPSNAATWRLTAWKQPDFQSVREAAWIEAALEHRPEIERAGWELAALGAEEGLTRWAALDGLEGGIEAEREGGDWSVGPAVSMALPLFDWGQADRERAAAAVVMARHELTAVRRDVVEEVRRACAVFNESVHEARRAENVLLPIRREQLELAEASYRAGQTALTDVIIADRALADAEERVVRLGLRVAVAWVGLRRAVGGVDVENGVIDQAGAVSDEYEAIDSERSGEASGEVNDESSN